MHSFSISRHHIRHARGFTLIEIVVVVAIALIVASMVLAFAADRRTTQLRRAAELLTADIAVAQMQSIGNGANPIAVVFHADSNSYHLVRSSDDTDLQDPATQRPYITTYGTGRALKMDGVTIHALEHMTNDRITFSATGSLTQIDDAKITLAAGAETLSVTVDAETGDTSVE